VVSETAYEMLKEKAAACACRIGPPSFYSRCRRELEVSAASLLENGLLRRCRALIDESELHPAHGISHGERVAVEAGAILRAECASGGFGDADALMVCAQAAGLLHDIKRAWPDHTIKGSIEAERLLQDLDVPSSHKRYIRDAIRNHEAFREVLESEGPEARLVSDALYDADKFRWGPDNFTTTLWLMMQHTATPVEELFAVFPDRMEGIRRIRDTFRSETGRRYGPEFIDMGIEIGNEIYAAMAAMAGE